MMQQKENTAHNKQQLSRFFKRSGLLLIPILCINFFFFFITQHIYYADYAPNKNPGKTLEQYHCFLLADSHGEAVSDVLDAYGIYNYSKKSDCYADLYRKLSFLLNSGASIQKIYVSMDDQLLSTYRDRYNNLNRSVYFTTYHSYRKTAQRPNILAYLADKYARYYFVLFNTDAQYLVKDFLAGKINSIGRNASPKKPREWADVQQKDRVCAARFSDQFPNLNRSAIQLAALNRIIEISLQHHIEVVGIKFPLSRDYLATMGNLSFGLDSFCTNRHIKLLDLRQQFTGNDSYFSDQDHLNDAGARAFAAQLMQMEAMKQQ